MPDPHSENPRLAAIYDPLEADRRDPDLYTGIVAEVGARRVLDVGCGTGTLCCALAGRGLSVVGLDPAAASLDVARGKPGAERVRWVLGEVAALPRLRVDLVTMTGKRRQVFLTDGAALVPDSTLRFRSREETECSPGEAGFVVEDVRDAPDRPGLELVVARSVPP